MLSNYRLRLGRISNVPITLDITFFALPLMALYFGGLPYLQFVAIVFASVLVHEFGHVLMARRWGVETNEVSLHILGAVAMLRWPSRLVLNTREHACKELWIAIAGPLTSIVLALLGLLAVMITEAVAGATPTLLHYFVFANMVIATLNMAPIAPLDGGRVLRAFLCSWMNVRKATVICRWIARAILATLFFWTLSNYYWGYAAFSLAVLLISERQLQAEINSYDRVMATHQQARGMLEQTAQKIRAYHE